MKKTLFSFLMVMILFLGGCENQGSVDLSNNSKDFALGETKSLLGFFGNRSAEMGYSTYMEKPDFEEMENKKEVQEPKFRKQWTKEYTLTEDDVDDLTLSIKNGWCTDDSLSILPYGESWDNGIKLSKKDLVAGKVFTVTGEYSVINPNALSSDVINQLKEYGFGLMDFSKEYGYTNYQEDFGDFYQEEWVRNVRKIGGESPQEYERYPFNTLLVTNDLLLHVFHKIFSNELQFYEESQARPILVELSKTMFDLSVNGSLGGDKEKNEFLAAYWTIPNSLLPSNKELLDNLSDRESHMWDNFDGGLENLQAEYSDQELKAYLDVRFEKNLQKINEKYQGVLKDVWEKIWEAKESRGVDDLMFAYSPEFLEENGITQDYTQFRPRSHYTNSSFLKTYFMAMKWMMREKFYFGDRKLAETAVYMVRSIDDTYLEQLNTLQNAILVLIGSDDDTTVGDIKTFVKDNKVDSSVLTEEQYLSLKSLKHQKIASAHYDTSEAFVTDEETAKETLDGFVFFGEKFTVDSYIFDLLTAGSAEVEYLKKPSIQTALIVPDILENLPIANELVNLWLNNKHEDSLVLEGDPCLDNVCSQISSYEQVRHDAQNKVKEELKNPLLTSTVYHKWLDLIGELFTEVKNMPYFKKSPLYQLKNLMTYMGSYTELKHDTLLYVKQAYAELGGAGGNECSVTVYPPALPVPKGYIEADINFIDKLIALNSLVGKWFDDNSKFVGYGEYLQKVRDIALKQMKNEVISDEDFEWLRLSYADLDLLTYPDKLFGQPSQKQERGALIADIFTSYGDNPLYEAVGRPLLMALMVKDANGARVVLGPVFSHYEFYKTDDVLEGDQRFTDEERQGKYDNLSSEEKERAYGIEMGRLFEGLVK